MSTRIPPAEALDHNRAGRDGFSEAAPAPGHTGPGRRGGTASRNRETGRNPAPARPRKLSRRQVRLRVTVEHAWSEDRWVDEQGVPWQVVNAHRKDHLVALQGPGGRPRYATFAQLAKRYRLVEGS